MALVTIWRDTKLFPDYRVIALRTVLLGAVSEALRIEPANVEVRVRSFGYLDINYAPVGIEIDTGTGKNDWRVHIQKELAQQIAERIHVADVLPAQLLGPNKSYAWLRICESAFVPIGHPDHSR